MSSWIPSLFNPFSDGDDEDHNDPKTSSPSAGAKEDLSAVFRGVAAFLAPPPPPQQTTPSSGPSSSETITGIKNDFAEIEGSLKSGLSLISSKLTSNFLHFQTSELIHDDDDDDDDDDAVGITEEVVDFVSKISGRPQLWTDFPLPLCDDEVDLSDYQREHAESIEHLVPEFVTLRHKICRQISKGKFWLIYFILLLPRLNEEDSKLLSTPQVIKARATLVNKLQNKTEETEPSESQHETVNATKQSDIVNDSEQDQVSFSDLEEDDKNNLSDKDNQLASKDKAASESEESNEWLTVDDTDFDNLASI